jgi:hypothetical protein
LTVGQSGWRAIEGREAATLAGELRREVRIMAAERTEPIRVNPTNTASTRRQHRQHAHNGPAHHAERAVLIIGSSSTPTTSSSSSRVTCNTPGGSGDGVADEVEQDKV